MMSRNERTGRFESTDTKKKNYKVYSEVLNKPFDSIAELEAAEEAVRKENEAKELATNEKRKNADIVKTAVTKRIETEAAARKAKADAYRAYLAELDKIDKTVAEAKKAESDALNTFCEKYGAYHDTIKIGDVNYTLNYTSSNNYVDPFEKLLQLWF